MKPVKNEKYGYWQIGDYWDGLKEFTRKGVITEFFPCASARICKERYINFRICGGYRRVVEGDPTCCFWIARNRSDMIAGSSLVDAPEEE